MNKIEELQRLYTEEYKNNRDRIRLYILMRCDYNEDVAQDITQNVFTTLWEETVKKNSLPADNLPAWLRTVADHKLSDYYKKRNIRRKRVTYLESSVMDEYPVLYDMEEEMVKEEIDSHIEEYAAEALKVLTPDEYELYQDKYVKKNRYDEITERAGISQSAARVRAYRLRQKVVIEVAKIVDKAKNRK